MKLLRTHWQKIQKFSFHITISILLLLAIPGALPVRAASSPFQEIQTESFTLKDFDYPSDQSFQGVQVKRTFNLTLPGDWSFPAEATLSIRFSHSPALNPISSMLVRWNGEPIGSTLLTKDNAQNGVLKLALPPENLNSGYNALQIEFFMGIAEDFCIDYDSPAVWAVVHQDTSITLTYQKQAQESDLNLVPGILIDSSPLADNTITLVVSPNPGLEVSQALARMGAKLGHMAQWRNTDIRLLTMDQANAAKPAGDLLIIGTLDQINDSFTEIYSQINILLSETIMNQFSVTTDDGLIFFQPSPFDPQAKSLTLTGASSAALEKSVSAATLNSFYEGASGTWSIVQAVPDLPKVPGSGALSLWQHHGGVRMNGDPCPRIGFIGAEVPDVLAGVLLFQVCPEGKDVVADRKIA